MQKLDLSILRFMRTRGHTPAVEKAAQLIARSGENGYLWFGIGLAGAALDAPRRKQWLASAAIGPAAIGLNFGIKLIVKRPRPSLEGLPPLGGAPSSLSFPSAHPEMRLATVGRGVQSSKFACGIDLRFMGVSRQMGRMPTTR